MKSMRGSKNIESALHADTQRLRPAECYAMSVSKSSAKRTKSDAKIKTGHKQMLIRKSAENV